MPNDMHSERLAILGGKPVRQRPWPRWPRADENTEKNLLDVLHSGRWAISGMYSGRKPYERQFAEAYAAFNDVSYAVPVCNGSASLVVALQALNIRPGDEVLVPGIVWVACASAVTRIGGVPILVDVEPDTLCMSLEAARKAVTPRTRVIMIVHLYSGFADIDGFVKLSQETGIPLLEDCSQAHGARWKGRRVGTFGDIGVFSLQDSKLLTCGEGGVAITSDPRLYGLMEQLRDDGRRYTVSPPPLGHPELEEIGTVQGYNYCMSEFHAAVLTDRLRHLDGENRVRHENALYLEELLAEVGDVRPLRRRPEVTQPTYYHYGLLLNRQAFGNYKSDVIRRALMAELNLFMEPVDDPLNQNILYNPLRSPRTREALKEALNPARFDLPVAARVHKDCLTFSHSVLLDDREGMEDIARAFSKVKKNHHLLSQLA